MDSESLYDEDQDKKEQALTIIQENAPEQAMKKYFGKTGTTGKRRKKSSQQELSVAVKAGKHDARKTDLNRRQIENYIWNQFSLLDRVNNLVDNGNHHGLRHRGKDIKTR